MKRYIKSAIDNSLLISDFMTILKDTYHEKFPRSYCDIWFSNLYNQAEVFMACYLGEDKSEWAYGIEDNDVFSIRVEVDFPNAPKNLSEDDYVPDYCEIAFPMRSIMTKPEDDWFYCDYYRPRFKAVKGTPEQMIETWQKSVDALYNETVRLHREGKLHKNAYEYYDVDEKLRLK